MVIAVWVGVFTWALLSRQGPVGPVIIPAGTNANGNEMFWFKGNIHAHAKIDLQGWTHGDSGPDEVVDWYRDHGYHFMALTDHNIWRDGTGLAGQTPTGEPFLVLPGMEVTSDYRYPGVTRQGERKIHATALNTRSAVDWSFGSPDKSGIIKTQFQRIQRAGGLAILNHPNYEFQVELQDILGAGDIRLVELFNSHPRANQAGHTGFRPSVESLWDQLLSLGQPVYAVASDDAHDFKWYGHALRRFGTAPPGGAWIMVRAAQLQADDLLGALAGGDFYSSTGVYLKQVSSEGGTYTVEIDMETTRHETRRSWIRDAAPVVFSDDSHFVIEFFGAYGRLLHSTHDQARAGFPITPDNRYIRSRVTYLDKLPSLTGADNARAFYAWTQPVFATTPSSAD